MSIPELTSSTLHYDEIPRYCLGDNILDVGSSDGQGALLSRHREHFLDNHYLGIDIQAFDKYYLPVMTGDILQFNTDMKFDTILLLHVLEHIELEIWPKLFTCLQDMLTLDGFLVVNVPLLQKNTYMRKDHMSHVVAKIDEELLSQFCEFRRFKRVGKSPILQHFRDPGESLLWAISRFIFRIITHHPHSVLRTMRRQPPRLVAIYQGMKEQ